MAQISLYSTTLSNRLQYTCRWIFEEVLAQEIYFTNSLKDFQLLNGIKINYSKEEIDGTLGVIPHGLLDEITIGPNPFSTTYISKISKWLEGSKENNYDYFSLVFYYLSRYEEYNSKSLDTHGRFTYKESINALLGITNTPVVDKIVFHLYVLLEKMYPNQLKWKPTVKTIPTIDVDMVYKYKGRPVSRSIGGIARDFMTLKTNKIIDRLRVLINMKADPYYVFQEFVDQGEFANSRSHIFLHCGQFGKFDKQVGLESEEFKLALSEIKKKHTIGLHPSYKSNDSFKLLQNEKLKLESLTQEKCINSRQHFLKIKLPETYDNLIKLGIKKDFSMGYAENTGFRAGTSRSFTFFNLENNKQTELTIQPFCAMDVSLKRYLNLDLEAAKKVLEDIKNEVQKYGGVYSILFHNESLSNEGEWKGWQALFK